MPTATHQPSDYHDFGRLGKAEADCEPSANPTTTTSTCAVTSDQNRTCNHHVFGWLGKPEDDCEPTHAADRRADTKHQA